MITQDAQEQLKQVIHKIFIFFLISNPKIILYIFLDFNLEFIVLLTLLLFFLLIFHVCINSFYFLLFFFNLYFFQKN